MTIYDRDSQGNMIVVFDSRWARPELLGFKPEEPIYQELQQMYAAYRRERQSCKQSN